MLTLPQYDVVKPFRPRRGRAQPYLLVGRLLVEDIGSSRRKGDVKNTGLECIEDVSAIPK